MKSFLSKYGLAFVVLILVFCGRASAENWRAFRSDDNRSLFRFDSILPTSKNVGGFGSRSFTLQVLKVRALDRIMKLKSQRLCGDKLCGRRCE
jgi:hypothetical protein